MRILVSLPAVVFVAPLALGPLPAHAHQSDPQPPIVIYCGEFGGVVSTPCRNQVQPAQGASPARPDTPRITAGILVQERRDR